MIWRYCNTVCKCELIEHELQKRFGKSNVVLELFSDHIVITVRHNVGVGMRHYSIDDINVMDIVEDVSSSYLMVKGGRKRETT